MNTVWTFLSYVLSVFIQLFEDMIRDIDKFSYKCVSLFIAIMLRRLLCTHQPAESGWVHVWMEDIHLGFY